MLDEFRKRPFMRPLVFWIIGIVMQSYFSCFEYMIWLLPFVLAVCILSFRKGPVIPSYNMRWCWGMVFLISVLFLAVCRTAYIEQSPLSSAFPPVLKENAEILQQRLVSSLDTLDLEGEEKAVLSTITLGYRKTMARVTKRKFSLAGVAHVLSVSGFHVAIVCGFLSILFCFLPRYRWAEWIRFILMLLLLWVFVFLSGLSASAIRAGLMLTFYFVARLLEKQADRYNIWAASALMMLVYNPHYLYDIGFELSFIAVFFLFWLQPDLKRWIIIRNPLLSLPWDWITVTLAAQIGVTFLCMYYFQEYSTVFLLSAIPVTAIVTLLIPSALIWMFLPIEWSCFCGWNIWVEWLTHAMFGIVDLLSLFPWVVIPLSMNVFDLLSGYGMLVFLILAFKKRYSCFLLAALFFLIIGIVF